MSREEIIACLARLVPRFPLESPKCRFCGWVPRRISTVREGNLNGNALRPYYICLPCKYDRFQITSDHERGWIAWNDARGIHPSNPNCDCGIPSRQDGVGVRRLRAGMGFWTCASGACSYYSELRNGQTPEEAAEYPLPENVTFSPWLW